MNRSTLAQLPDLLTGTRGFVSLWVSDLEDNKDNDVVFDVSKTLDGFKEPKSESVCTFCIYHWASFLMVSLAIKMVWYLMFLSLKYFSFSLIDLL